MPAGGTRTKKARAFNRQTGRFLHDDQHKRPVCRPFTGGDKHPADEQTAGARTGNDVATNGGTETVRNEWEGMID